MSPRDDVLSLLQCCHKLSSAMEDRVQGNCIALILHRSKCRCLVLSYKQLCETVKRKIEEESTVLKYSPPTVEEHQLGVSKFLEMVKGLYFNDGRVKDNLSSATDDQGGQEQMSLMAATCPSSRDDQEAQEHMSLIGPLKAFYQVAQDIEKCVDSCHIKPWTHSDDRQRWLVDKGLTLGLSSDILDLHLHDLLCAYFLVQQALWGGLLELEHLMEDIVCLKSIWVDQDEASDMDSFFNYLSDPFAKGSIENFIFKKLAMSSQLEASASNLLPGWLWIDPKDLKTDVANSVIGEGSFGIVSKTEWMGSIFAMKSFFHVEDPIEFGKEASLQARLRHPNVMHFLCWSMEKEQKRCSLVMPLMWQDLRALMMTRMENGFNPPFPLPLAVEFMLQIAKATSQGHPMADSSVFLQENLHLRIADFGVSKSKAASSRYMTKAGTTAWMAPEVYRIGLLEQDVSTVKYTKKADVYSFGMVCYEILTGHFPFEGPGIGERVLRGERPKIQAGHSCPFALATYIEKCWNQDPSLRPTFTQICRMLRYLKACIMLHDHPQCKMIDISLQSCSLSGPICDAVEERQKAVEFCCRGLHPTQLRIPLEMFYCNMVLQEAARNGRKDQQVHEVELHNGQNTQIEGTPSTTMSTGLLGSNTSLHRLRSANTTLGSTSNSSQYATTVEQFASVLRKFYKMPDLKQAGREFSYEELVQATNNFEMEIGSNAKHIEYKGKLQANGREIVVKKGRRGDELTAKDLKFVRGLEHPNVVPLLGWSWKYEAAGRKLLHLVYKYMPNGNLSNNILCGDRVMEWNKRYKVVRQLARVLEYMHHGFDRGKITHGDVRACNVWLDSNSNAHLANFGISWELDEKEIEEAGYRVPELTNMPKGERVSTAEVDVYSFGLTVLTVACGKGAFVSYRKGGRGRMRLRDWVWPLYEGGIILEAADERLAGKFNKFEMEHLLSLGLACSNPSPHARPRMDLVLNSFKKLRSPGFGFMLEGAGFFS